MVREYKDAYALPQVDVDESLQKDALPPHDNEISRWITSVTEGAIGRLYFEMSEFPALDDPRNIDPSICMNDSNMRDCDSNMGGSTLDDSTMSDFTMFSDSTSGCHSEDPLLDLGNNAPCRPLEDLIGQMLRQSKQDYNDNDSGLPSRYVQYIEALSM
ncbi:hypothetical protein TWF281_010908 [Arthrobotrys megalospora]